MSAALQKLIVQSLKYLPNGLRNKMAGDPVVLGGRTIDPILQIIWNQAKTNPGIETLPVDQARQGMQLGQDLLDGKPMHLRRIESSVIPTDHGDLDCRIYYPEGVEDTPPLMLWFHQGGFVIGDLDTGHTFCSMIANIAKIIVVNVAYRMGPEHRFPAAADDALAAYQWACSNAGDLGADPQRIAIGGDSAGGNLTAMLTHEVRKKDLQTPALQLMVYPWVAAREKTESYETYNDAYPLNSGLIDWFGDLYLNNDSDRNDPRLNPFFEDDFSNLPPAIVATAGFDPLVDEGEAYARKLEDAGIKTFFKCYDHLTHSFTMMRGAIPAAKAANMELAQKVKEFLAR